MTAFKLKSSRWVPWASAILAILLYPWSGGCSREEARPSHEEIVAAEFEVILDLHDQACGGVSSFEKVDDLAYKVTCTSGEVYRIHVSYEGHVNVATHTP
jgi:hypothetical protein